jgi:hypothetical protein
VNDILNLHGLVGAAADAPADWVRPADWLAMPEVLSTEQKFVGLHAVHPNDGNFLALLAQGAYTVDWGDGTTSNHASNTIAYKEYTYSSISSATDCIFGYRQVLVTVTPQVGQNLTVLNLKQKHNQAGLANGYSSGWLDISVSMPNCSGTGMAISANNSNCQHRMLERVWIKNLGGATSLSYGFATCTALQSVPLFDSSSVTDFSYLYSGCDQLNGAPALDTSNGVNLIAMYLGCRRLTELPFTDTSKATNFVSFAQNCSALEYVPPFDTREALDIGSMFNSCPSLQKVPPLNTTKVTRIVGFLQNSAAVHTIPALDLSAVSSAANFTNTFSACASISKISATGARFSFSVASCKLSAAALDEIYTNLPTVTGQTITVTSNYGSTGHTPSIATAKGWTVTA